MTLRVQTKEVPPVKMAAPVAKLLLGVCLYGVLEWQEVKSKRYHELTMENLNTIKRDNERAFRRKFWKRELGLQAE